MGMSTTLDRTEVTLTESPNPIAAANIDRENGVIRNVKVVGLTAEDKRRRYSPEALKGAVGLYEGAEVNIDHNLVDPTAQRGMGEGWGWLKGVYYSEAPTPGLYAQELEYLKSHQFTEAILERIERSGGKRAGLSHNARGFSTPAADGWEEVDEIAAVRSVDLVRDGATVEGLFESKQEPDMITKAKQVARRELLKGLAEKNKPARLLLQLTEMEGMGLEADMPVDAVATATPEEQVAIAFDSAILEVVHQDIDTAEKITRLQAILDAQAGAEEAIATAGANASAESDDGGEGGDGGGMQESKDELAAMRVQLHVRDELDKRGVKLADLSEARRGLLQTARSEKQATDLIESFELSEASAETKPKPRITPARGSGGGGSKSYDELKQSVRGERPKARYNRS